MIQRVNTYYWHDDRHLVINEVTVFVFYHRARIAKGTNVGECICLGWKKLFH